MSDDPSSFEGFGPKLPGLASVPYNDASALEDLLDKIGDKTAAFLVEPIQGEAGVQVPDDGYLLRCFQACKKHNVLFIADEIQTGLGRTGRMLAIDHENIKPDILILGKALAGGVLPMSAVLANRDIMLVIKPGEHGSTYGGNPLASAVGLASLKAIVDENMTQNAEKLGKVFRNSLEESKKVYPFIKEIRGKGLLNAMEIQNDSKKTAWDLCLILKNEGILAKPTHDNIIRMAPPLVITDSEMNELLDIVKKSLKIFSFISDQEILKLRE